MKKYLMTLILGVSALSGTIVGGSSSRSDLKVHLTCDVTIEKAKKLVADFEQQGPQAVNIYLNKLEAMKASKLLTYTITTNTVKKLNSTTLQYVFDAEICIHPSAPKEWKLLVETFIKNKSNNKMVHTALKQEVDTRSQVRSPEVKKWITGVKMSLFKAGFPYQSQHIDLKNPIFSSLMNGTKLGTYLHDKFGCTVKINAFRCTMVN